MSIETKRAAMTSPIVVSVPAADRSFGSKRICTRWLPEEDAYIDAQRMEQTCSEMGAALGRTASQIRNRCWLRKLEFKKGCSQPKAWSAAEVALLRKAYAGVAADDQIGLVKLAKKLKRDKANVCRKARELGLTQQSRPRTLQAQMRLRRPDRLYGTREQLSAAISERMKRHHAEKGHPRGMLGKKHTPEVVARMKAGAAAWRASLTEADKEAIVMNLARKRAAAIAAGTLVNERKGVTWKGGWRQVGEQRKYFRSRWEANYAFYLEWLRTLGHIAAWEHEAHTFWFDGIKRGCVSYLPDFKVTNPSGSIEWHEVKGWMDDRSKTVLRRMAKYHPAEKVIVIGEKQYAEIRRKVSSLVPGWES